MTREENLQTIREACIKANPEKEWEPFLDVGMQMIEPIRLADVLWAIWQQPKVKEFAQAVVMQAEEPRKLIAMWNLRKDNLEDQSDECLQFLCGLLR